MAFAERLQLALAARHTSLPELTDRMVGLRLLKSCDVGRLSLDGLLDADRPDNELPPRGVIRGVARALGVSLDFLLPNHAVVMGSPHTRRGKPGHSGELPPLPDAAVDGLRMHLLTLVEQHLFVEARMGVDSAAEWCWPAGFPRKVATVAEAEAAAEALRTAWKLGMSPIANLTQLLERRGVRVCRASLPIFDDYSIDGISAVVKMSKEHAASGSDPKTDTSDRLESMVPLVCLNMEVPGGGERQRFTLAHELGHLLLELDGQDEACAEVLADRFAAALLLPAEAVRQMLGDYRDGLGLAEMLNMKVAWGVSLQSVNHRCLDLGVVDANTYASQRDTLLAKWDGPGGCNEPSPLPKEQPTVYAGRVLRASQLDNGGISAGRAAELMSLTTVQLWWSGERATGEAIYRDLLCVAT